MQHSPRSRGMVSPQVAIPGNDYALQVARGMPVGVPPSAVAMLPLPLPAHEDASVEFLFRTLFLPGRLAPRVEVAPRGIEAGLQSTWQQHPGLGLFLPEQAAREWTLAEHSRAKILLVPSTVGLDFGPAVLADLAWKVLSGVPVTRLAAIVADAAMRAEILGVALSPIVARAMRLGQPLAGRLDVLARSGEVLIYHDCLRWVLRELAAGLASGELAACAARPVSSGVDHAYAARVLFPSLTTGTRPSPYEIFRALWVLHEAYTFSPGAHVTYTDNHEAVLSMMTAMVHGQPQWGAWAARMERWLKVFETPDGAPSVARLRLRPSAFRAAFQTEVGVSIDEWMAMMWLLGMRYMVMVTNHDPALARPLSWLMTDSFTPPLEARFERALRAHGVTDLNGLGAAVLAEASAGSYSGLGSLPAFDGLAVRNAPLLEVDTDVVIPCGLHLLAERAVALPRMVVGRRTGTGGWREVNGLLGKCFEAHMEEVAMSARPRHQVLIGADIDAVVPAGDPRCDVIIVYGDHWLLVESGLQIVSDRVGRGDVTSIRQKCLAYHDKADQADSTLRHLGALARHHSLIPPSSTNILLVTDLTVPFTVPLLDELRRQRRRRNPLFIGTMHEFEWLTAAGVNWSIPSLVAGWQNREHPVPLLVHLWRTNQLLPVAGRQPDMDPASWLARAGTSIAA